MSNKWLYKNETLPQKNNNNLKQQCQIKKDQLSPIQLFNKISYSMRGQNQASSDSEEQGQRYMNSTTTKKRKTQYNFYPTLFKRGLNIQKKIVCKDGFYFPFDPYPMQLDYMKHIKKCLDEGKNCVIESPTGSGKTQCLLNAVFGWVQAYYDNKKKKESQKKVFEKQYPIKIIYSSRSHSQLEQLKQQIQKTCYRLSMVVMGSRKQLCAYESIRVLTNINEINSKCQRAVKRNKALEHYMQLQEAEQYAKQKKKQQNESQNKKQQREALSAEQLLALKQQSCQYYSSWKKRQQIGLRVLDYFKDQQKPIDINDQYQRCKQVENTCPYYYPTVGKYFADLVVMPYNYILNERLMRRNAAIISNNILIFDEGHSILDFARDGKSFKLRAALLDQLIRMLKKYAAGKGLGKRDIDIDMFDGGQQSQEYDQIVSEEEEKDIQLEALEKTQKKKGYKKIILKVPEKQHIQKAKKQIINLSKTILQSIHKFHNNFKRYQQENKLPFQDEENYKFTSALIDDSTDEHTRILQIIKQMSRMLSEVQLDIGNKLQPLKDENVIKFVNEIKQVGSNLQQLFQKIQKLNLNFYPYVFSSMGYLIHNIGNLISNQDTIFDYSLYIDLISKKNQPTKLEMRFHCHNSKLMFQELKKLNPRAIIITSGTLAPIQSWKRQTGIENLQQFSNNSNHVIQQWQCQTIFLPRYDGGSQWYTWTKMQQSCRRAMEAIQHICKQTPGGILVVLPSKSWLNPIRDIFADYRIKKIPLYEDILSKKEINLQQFKEQYKKICSNQGGILFAVSRGKLSEGINLEGDMCRAAVVVGCPIPSMYSPDTQGKYNYAQRLMKKYPQHYSKSYLKEWKDQEVIRAVNQGIGRVIRNKNDYGMIFLLDGRYLTEQSYRNNISKWAMKNIKTLNFDKIEETCKDFFNQIKEKMPK